MIESFDINNVDAILKRVAGSSTEQVNFISDGKTMKVISEERSIDVDEINGLDYYTKEELTDETMD